MSTPTPAATEKPGTPAPTPHDAFHEAHGDDHQHHVPMSMYYLVFAFLMVMLLITVAASKVDLGHANAPVAVIIAFMKAAAIVMIFMHAKFSSKLVQIFACTGLIFGSILFLLTFNDYLTRPWFAATFR